jgi:hypothetical protein
MASNLPWSTMRHRFRCGPDRQPSPRWRCPAKCKLSTVARALGSHGPDARQRPPRQARSIAPKASGVIQFDLDAIDRNPARPGGWGLASPRSSGAIRGRAGISYAAAVLLDPTKRPSIRAVAEQAGMSHGAIGEAAKLMRETGLIRRDGERRLPRGPTPPRVSAGPLFVAGSSCHRGRGALRRVGRPAVDRDARGRPRTTRRDRLTPGENGRPGQSAGISLQYR